MNAAADRFNPRHVTPGGTLEVLAREFLKRLALRGYAPATVDAYRIDLEQFVGYMTEQRCIRFVCHVTTRHVNDFLDALINGHGITPRSASRKLSTCRKFFKFCIERGEIRSGEEPTKDVDPVRFTVEPVIAPEESAVRRFLGAIPRDTTLGIRDYAMFRVIWSSGLRVGGLCSLDVEPNDGVWVHGIRPSGVVYYRKKGGATGETLIADDETLAAVDAWLDVRHKLVKRRNAGEPALFITQTGCRMNRFTLDAAAKKYGKAARLPGFHSHLLRHARIGQALESSDIHIAHYIAGHKHKATTVNMYGTQSRERLRERLRNEAPIPKV